MKHDNIKLARVRSLASRLSGDPRSVFYGDVTVEVKPEDASAAVGQQAPANTVVESAIASEPVSETAAATKLAAYNSMSDSDRAGRTLLPPLACWNAMVIISPQLGKVLAKALDYMLLKALNDYPFEGTTAFGSYDAAAQTTTVRINSDLLAGTGNLAGKYIAIPFFRFSIAASTLNAAPGAQVKIDFTGTNAEGRSVSSRANGYTYSFQRLSNTEAVLGIFIPTVVVATRTLPFMPIAGDAGTAESKIEMTITFTGTTANDHIAVTIPGYATAELKEISAMYNLPAGMIR